MTRKLYVLNSGEHVSMHEINHAIKLALQVHENHYYIGLCNPIWELIYNYRKVTSLRVSATTRIILRDMLTYIEQYMRSFHRDGDTFVTDFRDGKIYLLHDDLVSYATDHEARIAFLRTYKHYVKCTPAPKPV